MLPESGGDLFCDAKIAPFFSLSIGSYNTKSVPGRWLWASGSALSPPGRM
jgi:hypothetical protein